MIPVPNRVGDDRRKVSTVWNSAYKSAFHIAKHPGFKGTSTRVDAGYSLNRNKEGHNVG